MKGQPDLMVLDYHKDYKGLCVEFKSPTNNYHVSKAQYELMEKYSNNSYKFILSNDYDEIIASNISIIMTPLLPITESSTGLSN